MLIPNMDLLEANWTPYSGLRHISLTEYMNCASHEESREKIVNEITRGGIIVVDSVCDASQIFLILDSVLSRIISASSHTKILEGIANFSYVSENLEEESGRYSTVDRSWYFFPWNSDSTGIFNKLQPLIDTQMVLNGYSPLEISRNTPINMEIQRLHLVHYPIDSGKISWHIDPNIVQSVNAGIYLSKYGEDYCDGGFFVLDREHKPVNIDQEVSCGDLVLFSPNLVHSVLGVKEARSLSQCQNREAWRESGRYFLNIAVVESHEKKLRASSIGIKLS